jgi:hypothetical protein
LTVGKPPKGAVLPPISSIFENKDLMKKINLIKQTLKKVNSQVLVKKKPSTLKQIYKQQTQEEMRPRSGSQAQRHSSKRRLLEQSKQ